MRGDCLLQDDALSGERTRLDRLESKIKIKGDQRQMGWLAAREMEKVEDNEPGHDS